MIVFSFVLVLAALLLLIIGLFGASQALIWSSIVASAVAGLCLVLAVAQQRRRQAAEEGSGGELGIHDPATDDPTTIITPVAGEAARERGQVGAVRGEAAWDEPTAHHEPPDLRPAVAAATDVPLEHERHERDTDSSFDRSSGSDSYQDPHDEPIEESVSDDDVRRTADLPYDVIVVDGRPRYHLVDCNHLHDRDIVSLPLAEARESGFTPCSLCRPDSTLAARARERFGS